MTITDLRAVTALRPVAVDLYRDIHKGIRAELFALTETAGTLDPSSRGDRAALAAHARRVVDMLVSHAEHEDEHVQPAIEVHLPALAEQIEADHHVLEDQLHDLAAMAEEAVTITADARWHTHRLYIELASFTSSYLAHQDLEERLVMPALEDAIGADAAGEIHEAVVSSIPPEEMATSLAVMLPSMNVDDRTDLLGGMRAGAPPEAFAGVWDLAGSVLDPRDIQAVATRLGM